MKNLTVAALFFAVSISAQNNPPSQTATPAVPEDASKAAEAPAQPPAQTVTPEQTPWWEESRQRLVDLGYDVDPKAAAKLPMRLVQPTTPCAVPLAMIPVPDKNGFAIRSAPANPSVDPKIVQSPVIPACTQKAPTTIERRVVPIPEKK